jgi:sulfoxide reductase heme-binding subunit YedZ
VLTAALLTLLGLALSCAATVFALLAVLAKNHPTHKPWLTAILGTSALAAATLSGTASRLDLPAIAAVVLFGGISGAGWDPRGKRILLLVGLLCLCAAAVARFFAFSNTAALGGEAVAQAVAGITLTWATARAAGLVAFLAAAGAIILGARHPARLPIAGLPARVYALHRALGIVALLATATHLLALWLDEFIEFSWAQLLLVPWTSSYEPFGVTLGWIALLLLVLAAASGALRRWLPGWRVVHAVSYLIFALGLVHGLIAGTDAGSPLALAFYLATLLAAGWATYRRLFRSSPPPRRAPNNATSKAPAAMPDTTKRRSKRVLC